MLRSRAARAALCLLAAGTSLLAMAPIAAAASPRFQLPFACGEVWMGSTYKGHGHEDSAVDFSYLAGPNAGREVHASAAGTVVDTSAWSSNGEVVIRHADGWTTAYAHLDNERRAPAGNVAQGALLGYVDPTPNPYYVHPDGFAHLHYEQRLYGVAQPVVINGARLANGVAWRSANCPPPPPPVIGGPALAYVDAAGAGVSIARWGGPATTAQPLRALTAQAAFAVTGDIGDRVAAGDFDADGIDDLLAAVDTGAGATFLVWSGATGVPQVRFSADALDLDAAGSRLVVGDWNADGRDDVGLVLDMGHNRMGIRRYLSAPAKGGYAFVPEAATVRGAFDVRRVANRVVSGNFDNRPGDDVGMAYQAADGRLSIFVFSGADAAANVGADDAPGTWYVGEAPYDLGEVAGRMVAAPFSGTAHDDIALARSLGDGTLVLDRFETAASGGVAALSSASPAPVPATSVGNRMAAADITGDKVADVVLGVATADGGLSFVAWPSGSGASFVAWSGATPQPLAESVRGRMVVGDWE